MTVWIEVGAEFVIVKNWERGRSLYLRQLVRELDPQGSMNLDAGTLRKDLEKLVYQGNLTRREKRIIDKDRRARRVVYYEPTTKLITSYQKL